jgi:hypothetical protein
MPAGNYFLQEKAGPRTCGEAWIGFDVDWLLLVAHNFILASKNVIVNHPCGTHDPSARAKPQ